VLINPIDAAVLALVAVAAWFGYQTGFVATMYGLASWIVALAAGVSFLGPSTTIVARLTGVAPPLAATIGFVLTIVIAEALLSVAGYIAIRPVVAFVRRSPFGAADKILGTLPGALRSLLVVAVAILAIETLPIASEVKAAVETSGTGRAVNVQLARFQPGLEAFGGRLGGAPLLVTRVGEDQTERLDLPDQMDLAPDAVAERELFDLVNEERTERGIGALEWDERLVPVARSHSQEMLTLKYFSHDSPVAGSPFDRITSAGIPYSRAGENLALAQSISVAHRALMDSPGHRENILRPEFTRIGIGVITAGPYGRMITQLFLTP
jgi:uncharacterized membrane protein required for colicin V production